MDPGAHSDADATGRDPFFEPTDGKALQEKCDEPLLKRQITEVSSTGSVFMYFCNIIII
jgi:hypothetical protein